MSICNWDSECKQQAVPAGMHGRPSSVRVPQSRLSRRLHSGFSKAFEALLARRCALHWRRPNAEELRSDASTGRTLASAAVVDRYGKADDTRRSSRVIWTCRNTLPGESTTFISIPSIKNLSRERFGVFQMLLRRHSRASTRSRNSVRRPRWAAFLRKSRRRATPDLTTKFGDNRDSK